MNVKSNETGAVLTGLWKFGLRKGNFPARLMALLSTR